MLLGCSETVNRAGDGSAPERRRGPDKCLNGIDGWVDVDTAAVLKSGQDLTDTICPIGDVDYFKVRVEAGHELLRVKLVRSTTISEVKLTYLILDAEGRTVGTSPPSDDGAAYNALHCLAPGDYVLLVRDEGDDGSDGANPYKISVSSEDDPNADHDDDFDSASPLSGAVPGHIACLGDADFYAITVGANQLLEVKLTTSAVTPVDIKYTIYDSQRQWVADQLVPDGFKGPAALQTLHALPADGTYFVKVEDADNDDDDPNVAYTLSVTLRGEEDPHDKGQRNDAPATATPLGSGPSLDETVSGQIASRADIDYFRIDGLGAVNADNPAVLELSLSFDGPVALQPAVALIYGDANSPCTKDACCRVLAPDGPGCTNHPFDCAGSSFSCIDKGETFCTDQDCSPGASSTACPVEQRCAGAAVCLPTGSCGAAQVVRFDGTASDGASIETAQPLLHPGPWYIRVSDHQNNDYQHGKNYTLRVKLRMDPDGNKELNSYYNPTTLSTSLQSVVRAQNVKAAKSKPTVLTVPFTVRGYISYEGDKDWYVMNNPCPGTECTMTATYKTIGTGCENGPAFVYSLLYADGREKDNWPASPAPARSDTFGGSETCWLSRNSSNYILAVNDHHFDDWSWSCGYEISVSVHADHCAEPCQVYGGTCYVP